MRQWSPSSKSLRTSSWLLSMRIIQAPVPVSNQGQALCPHRGLQSGFPVVTGPMSLLAEPPKSGVKEKRKKAASFQTVSQLHKVSPS